jgi:tRNA threonylcarbamoyladenosine biosynthesis protein TsaB
MSSLVNTDPDQQNPSLLVIDTTSHVSIALTHHDRAWSRILNGSGALSSEYILPMIDELLKDAKCDPQMLDAIGCGVGPGSFTGLRMASGITQGLAFGWNKPVVAVNHLQALAAMLRNPPVYVLSVIDARMQQVYWALYAVPAKYQYEEIIPASASSITTMWDQIFAAAEFYPKLRYQPLYVAGDSQLLTDVAAIERVKYRLPRLEILEPMTLVAFDLLASTREAWRKGQLLDPAQLAPLYIRNDVAKTLEERGLSASPAQ